MPLKHKHTSLCTAHCLFVLSTTKERSFSVAQYLSLNAFPARAMRRDPFMWTPAVPTVWSILKKLTQDGETRVSKYKTSKSWNVVTSKNDDHQHLISVKWQHESSSAAAATTRQQVELLHPDNTPQGTSTISSVWQREQFRLWKMQKGGSFEFEQTPSCCATSSYSCWDGTAASWQSRNSLNLYHISATLLTDWSIVCKYKGMAGL